MPVFEKKQLDKTKRVCLRLKEAREKAGVSLNDLAEKTKINKQHLIAIEECRFNDIPHAIIYQKNFLKKYTIALNLPIDEILSQFITEETHLEKMQNLEMQPACRQAGMQNNKKIKITKLNNFPSFFRLASIIILVFGLVGYIGWQIRSIVKPPQLTLYSPQNGYVTADHELIVKGKTNKETQVSVNGKTITSDGEGQFTEIINLSIGINTITVSAKKKHGKSTEVVRHVTLKSRQVLGFND